MATLEETRPAPLTREERQATLARMIRTKIRRLYAELGEVRRLAAQLEASHESDTEEDTDDGETEARGSRD